MTSSEETVPVAGGGEEQPSTSDHQPCVIPSINSSKSFDDSTHSRSRSSRGGSLVSGISPNNGNAQTLQIHRSFSMDDIPAATPPTTATTTATKRRVSVSSVVTGNINMALASESTTTEQTTELAIPTVVTSDDASIPTNSERRLREAQEDMQAAEDLDASSPASSYEEGEDSEEEMIDSDVLLAKEMALAIANNPNMTPVQLRELQQQVQERVEQNKKDRELSKIQQKQGAKKGKKLSGLSSEIKIMKTNAKETYKGTKQSAKAQAKVLKKEFKKGLRAMGLMNQPGVAGTGHERTTSMGSSSDDLAAITTTGHDSISLHTPGGSLRLDEDGESIRLAGTIWKRRSGLGKYSITASWERRRVVLKGSKLIYYKTLRESMREGNSSDDASSGSPTNLGGSAGGYSEALEGYMEGAANSASGWINTFMDKTGVTIPWETNPTGARGYMDLRKEKASAAASYGHTGAPTPFALSIKVGGVTKYKFCYDTQHDLMAWLAAITDVVVAGSVDDYNAEILGANDPSSHGVTTTGSLLADTIGGGESTTWHEPPPTSKADEQGGHRLWSTEQYLVKSGDYPPQQCEHKSADSNNTDDDDDWLASPKNYYLDTSEAREVCSLPAAYVKPAFYVMNAVILSARSQTALSEESFWYVFVFFNVLVIMLVDTAMVGGTIQLKPGLDTKRNKQTGGAAALIDTTASADSTEKGGIITAVSVDENFLPQAGSSAMRIENPKDLPTKDGVIFAGWRTANPSDITVRGHTYKTDKQKVPCPGDLYECVELDIFESKKRVPDMAGRVILPTVSFENDDGPKTWNAPDLFVITLALPTDAPKLYGGSTDNGGGYTITMYCKMRQKTRDTLRRITADGYNPAADEELKGDMNKSTANACRLLDEWCRRAPSDDNWMARFKVFPQGNNLEEIGLPSWICNYNGKPFLIKRPGTTGFLYRHPDKSCMEFDVSLHPFPYVAKQGICYMKDGYFKKILATLAFCIEGRTEDELPECMIGLFQLCYPNPVYGIQADDFFSGKSASSK